MPESERPQEGSIPTPEGTPYIYFIPQQLMLQAFQSWQQLVNHYTQDLLRNRHVLDTNWKLLEQSMHLKKEADRAMELAVSSMQMPTRSDIEPLLQKLSVLESLVRDMGEKVDQLLDREHESRPRVDPI